MVSHDGIKFENVKVDTHISLYLVHVAVVREVWCGITLIPLTE